MSLFDLTDKTAVVTGAGGLIGKALCAALSDAGAIVAVCDIDFNKANSLSNDIANNSFPVELDVTNPESLQSANKLIINNTGKIDILINNAAINDIFASDSSILKQSSFENYPLELWEKSFEVNVTGTFLSCKIFGNEMAKRNYGSIINVASTYGIVGPDQAIYKDENGKQKFYKSPSYPAGKGAIVNFTRFLAAYWGKNGVRVNTLSPGGVFDGQEKYFVENYSKKTMLGRMATPDDYKGPVIFLASDSSSYMTGANLVIDGGWTAW
jgi:NAD(P)-dependent dehydrogenase (short-subunit alcohol dehydrogenase family)